MTKLTLIMRRFIILFGYFEDSIYYVYIDRLERLNICMCFLCLQMKYLGQIRALLTVLLFSQNKPTHIYPLCFRLW